ncbi:MAG: O-methyltransferase [Nannocystaceae bacterium]
MTDSPLLDIIHPDVRQYILSLGMETDPHIIKLATYAKEHAVPRIDIDAGNVLELLTRMIGARRVYEFGSAFGFSTYFLARAVGPQGEVHGSEPNEELITMHQELFGSHPYRERMTIHQGDGLEILAGLEGSFDVIFIDMDKPGYPDALRASVERVRPGGLVIADNVLWSGRTAVAPEPSDANTEALREFNRMAHADARLRTAILPVSDGLSVSFRVS